MARKVRVHDFVGRASKERWTQVYTIVKRTAGNSAANTFEACAWISSSGRSSRRRPADERIACARGPAPRRALGKALKLLGSTLVKRSSAFRGS